MNEDVCTACGERNPAGSAFCLYCGVYLGWDQAAPDEQPTVRQPAIEQSAAGHSGPGQSTASQSSMSASGQAATGQTAILPETHAQAPRPPYEDDSGRPKPGEMACPQCGIPNAQTLRFCRKCGRALHPSASSGQAPQAVAKHGWWQRFWDPKDRRARRDYRRSLPPLYRWRRVIVAVGAIAVAWVLLSVVGTNPVTWAKDRVNDVRGTLVPVELAAVAAAPPESIAAGGYSIEALTSAPLDDAWATPWATNVVVPLEGCSGKAAAQGTIRLSFPEAVRVRRLDVLAGLPATDARRPLQFRPSVLLVLSEGRCQEVALKDSADVQKLELDTGVPVKDLTIAIGATYPGRAGAAQPVAAITSLAVQSRPR
ncbi:zinc ribbon domain-containing protein [Kribbella endophytica]